MFDRLIAWAVHNRAFVFFGIAALIGSGLFALRTLRVDAFPDLTDVQVQVLAEAPGLSPLEVERLVAFPIEVALNGLPRVIQVRSLSKYAFAAATVVFEDGVDLYFARTLVAERLQAARSNLPAGTEVALGPLAGATSEIYLYALEGAGRDLMELRTIHDRIVRPQLRTVPGVTEVNSFGGLVRQVQIVVRPDRLLSYGLTLHDVVEAVKANNTIAAGGYLEQGDEQLILRGLGQALTLDDIRRTVIRSNDQGVPVLIGDVATLDYGPEVRQGAVSRDGKGEVVTGIIMMLRGENSREVVRRVRERVEEINGALPDGVRVASYYDQTDLVEGTIRTVRLNLLEGGLMVIAVLLLFLGNLRAALIVAATIPLSLLFAFLGMRWLGLSANLMSLGAIDFGMIVDGSVVMTEQFVRALHADQEHGRFPAGPKQFARRLIALGREVARPIFFGVLIILLVYLPILTLQGLEGRMFKPMAMTVAIALFGSLILAMVWIPAAATWVFRRGAPESRLALRLAASLERRYEPALGWAIRHPGTIVMTAVTLLASTVVLAPRLGTEFMPELDEGSILIEATRDPSVSLTRSIAMQKTMEATVIEVPEVTTVVSRVGRPEIGSDPMGINRADVFVMLKPRSEWRPGVSKPMIERQLEESLNDRVPGIAFGFTQPVAMRLNELVSGVRADLAVKVFGDDASINRGVAARVAAALQGVPGASQVLVEATEGQPYLNVRLDRSALARFGIPVSEVQEALETAVGGRPVSQMVEGSFTIDVTVQYPTDLRTSPEAIGAIAIPTPRGARIALAQLADIRLETGPVQMSRERAQRLVVVQANVEGRDLGGFVAEVKRVVAEQVVLPPGVFLVYGGQFENQERAMARLKLVVPVSILLIAGLLFVSLRSWGLATLVMLNLPFAAVGGVAGLAIRQMHLGVSAAVGFIALFGVAVLNGLVLLTTVSQLRQEGLSGAEAALAGGVRRLRPVLMTALVAGIGFIPVAVSRGVGAEVQRPLATVVIGGLITSTLLTLFVLPSLYVWLQRRVTAKEQAR
ncbi:MAG: efflux RND transporter permease subunit [Gemmatimonadales bacterium]